MPSDTRLESNNYMGFRWSPVQIGPARPVVTCHSLSFCPLISSHSWTQFATRRRRSGGRLRRDSRARRQARFHAESRPVGRVSRYPLKLGVAWPASVMSTLAANTPSASPVASASSD
jgi:hypothetical protein